MQVPFLKRQAGMLDLNFARSKPYSDQANNNEPNQSQILPCNPLLAAFKPLERTAPHPTKRAIRACCMIKG